MSSDTEKSGAPPATAAGVPEGAIAVDDDVYMVPRSITARQMIALLWTKKGPPVRADGDRAV